LGKPFAVSQTADAILIRLESPTVITPFSASPASAMMRVYERRGFFQVLLACGASVDAGNDSDRRRAVGAEHEYSVAVDLEHD